MQIASQRDYILVFAFRVVMGLIGLFILFTAIDTALDYRMKTNDKIMTVAQVDARQIEKQLVCLSKNIYWEAASEPFEGKVAVAQVTMNRLASGKFANSVCDVVYQKTTVYSRVICQFSWLCENNHQVRPVNKTMYKESEEVAKMVMLEGFRLPTIKEALYYHADYVNPHWKKERIAQIGRHIFYRD